MIFERVAVAGFTLDATNIELLGAGASVPGLHAPPKDIAEVVFRVSARSSNRAALERFTAEFAPLITSGPPGLAGYAAGRSPVRPVFAYWPTLIPRAMAESRVETRPARDWSQRRCSLRPTIAEAGDRVCN